jgi:hypothetical protein
MRPHNLSTGDPADATIRRTLRGWALSASVPVAEKDRLLAAARGTTRARSLAACWRDGASGTARRFLRSAARATRFDPLSASGYPAFEYAFVESLPRGSSNRLSRREQWHMFSFGVMALTLIR